MKATFCRTLAALWLAGPVLAQPSPRADGTAKQMPVIVNMAADGVVNFLTPSFREHGTNRAVAEAALDKEVDQYQGTGVSHLFWNVNYQRAGYNSAVWPSYWDVPDPEKQVTDWPCIYYLLHKLGLDDIFARLIPRTREKGMSPWVSLRMNDHHYFNDFSRVSPLLFNHPELRVNRNGLFNYAKPEVREHYMKLIAEVLQRYDIDGVELDWIRSPNNFEAADLDRGRGILTDFVREARGHVQAAAQRCGHPVKLAVRVPATPEFAYAKGFDAVRWAQEGLVDMIIVSDFWSGCGDLPIERWRSEIGSAGDRCTLMAFTAGTYSCVPKGFQFVHNVASQRGFTASMADRGADGIYLFNHFHAVAGIQRMRSPEGKSVEDGTLGDIFRAAADLKGAATHRRLHALTLHDCLPDKTDYRPALPAALAPNTPPTSLRLHTGPKPPASSVCRLFIGLGATNGVETAQIAAGVNGAACGPLPDLPRPTKPEYLKPKPDNWMTPPRRNISELATRVLVFDVPATAMTRGHNTIALTQTDGLPQTVTWLEVSIAPSTNSVAAAATP